MKTVALIPIRAGSKGIPGKNIKEMCGKPLCHWVIEAAVGAKSVDEVWVSTDYDEDVVGHLTTCTEARVEILYRPDWLATDTASSDDVLRHFCWNVCEPDDHVVMLQATSPLTTSDDIDTAYRVWLDKRSPELEAHWNTTMVSVVDMPKRLYWSNHEPMYSPQKRPLRDEIRKTYMENGAFYMSHAKRIMMGEARVKDWSEPHVMPSDTATEIDTPEDWDIVEKLLEARLS